MRLMPTLRNITRLSVPVCAALTMGFTACDSEDEPATDTTTQDTTDTSSPDTTDTTAPDTTDTTTPPDTTPTDPCDPNPCTTAPGPRCNEAGDSVITSAGPGTCTASGTTASCAYTETTTACGAEKTCAAGACVDVGDACDYVFDARVSYVTEIKVVSSPAATGASRVEPVCCFDFNDDGTVDNKLGDLLSNSLVTGFFSVNTTLQEQISEGGLVLLLETKNVTDVASSSNVAINGFYGADADADLTNNATGMGSFVVSPSSFAPNTASPVIAFTGASIASSTLNAGPSIFRLSIPLLGASLDLAINGTRFESPVSAGPAGADKGLSMGGEDGAKLGGYVAMRDLAAAFNAYFNAECTCVTKKDTSKAYVEVNTGATAESLNINIKDGAACTGEDEDTCKSAGDALGSFGAILGGLLSPDIDANEDGVKESLSIGVRLKATSAMVDGVAECPAE
jgi:hypothetical protein